MTTETIRSSFPPKERKDLCEPDEFQWPRLAVTSDRLALISEGIEDSEKLGNGQKFLQFLGQVQQLQLASRIGDRDKGTHQLPNAGAVYHAHVSEIE